MEQALVEHNLTLLGKLARWSRKRTPWVFHINASSCNGCDIEIVGQGIEDVIPVDIFIPGCPPRLG
jgi:Ni,Fe-hydrogenase III small subunit